jgi:hypothetical protein
MGQHIDRLPFLSSGNLLDEIQAVLPDHPAMFLIFGGNLFGGCQCDGDLPLHRFVPVRLGLSFGDAGQLPLNRPRQIYRRRPGSFESHRCVGQVLIKRITPCRLDCCKVHPVSSARSDQARSPHMHFPDCGRYLRDRVDFLDHETVRQKSLIDQLHDLLICWLKPDRPKMLSAYLHVSVYVEVTLERFKYPTFNKPRSDL